MKKVLLYSLTILCAIGAVIALFNLAHAGSTSEVLKQIVFLILDAGGASGWWYLARKS